MSIDWLVVPTLTVTAALMLVLALRRTARQRFGASAAYALWWLAPASMVALLIPAAPEPVLPVLAGMDLGAAGGFAFAASGDQATTSWPVPILAWAAGALAVFAFQLRQQFRFYRRLGPISRRPDGYFQSLAVEGLPAVVGMRQRIVLPGDFDVRYTARERALVLAHEREHRRRGDPLVGLFTLGLRVVFWFHPLVHLAHRHFRNDQELACDAAVLRRFPTERRIYAQAMLKTPLDHHPLPLGCHWRGDHSMKERIAMLKNPLPTRTRRLTGYSFVLLACLGAASATWATQAGEGMRPDARAEPAASVLVSLKAEATTVRRAALEIAEQSGWTIENPGVLDDSRRFDLAFDAIPVETAFALVVSEHELQPEFTGNSVRYVDHSSRPKDGGMAAAGISGAAPAYPPAAADAGEGGVVMLKVRIGTDGSAREVHFVADKSTVAADSQLARSSIEAASKWSFEPRRENGKPVEDWVFLPVKFEPPAKAAAPDA